MRMMWKRPILYMLVSALLATHAFAQAPKHPRAPEFPAERVLDEVELFGGAIHAVVEVANVDVLAPGYLNGRTANGLADIHFEVQLRAAKDNVLGARVAGEFIPYQNIRVRIENVSTPSSEVLEFRLAPHLGRAEGWHYASNVILPPSNTTGNPFNDDYAVRVTMMSDNVLYIHSDAMPPSDLFRGTQVITLYDEITQLGPRTEPEPVPSVQPVPPAQPAPPAQPPTTGGLPSIVVTELPVGDVDKQQALVAQFSALKDAIFLSPPDFVTASTIYIADTGFGETLESTFQSYEDPTRYDPRRGLTAEVLAMAEDNVAAALAQQRVGNDCNVGGLPLALECQQWIDKGGQRMFYLNLLHEIDVALPKIEAGAIDAVEGAGHNWDEAWAFWQALRGTAMSREANCEEPEFGDPAAIDCDLVDSIDNALLAGANAIANGGAGIQEQVDILEERLSQLFYLATYHEIVSAREKDPNDATGFGKARAEGAAFFSAIEYLVPGFDASALQDRRQENFTQAVAQDFMLRLRAAFSGIVRADRLGDPTTIP